MTAVEKAEATIKSLQDKQKDLTARATELAEERRHIALAAHSGADSKARARLDKINAEHATFSSEMNSLAEAILEATDRLKAAQQDEARTQDREKAIKLAEQLEAFVQCGQDIDTALAVIVESGRKMEQTLTMMNALGGGPNNSQLTTLGALALHTALMQTPWAREFRHLAPRERQTFTSLIEAWHGPVAANIERRLSQKEAA